MKSDIPDKLFVFTLANSKSESKDEAIRAIRECAKACHDFPFKFAIKVHYRNEDGVQRASTAGANEAFYLKQVAERAFCRDHMVPLVTEIKANGFIAVGAPFDELSVGMASDDGFDIIQLGNAFSTDWPLLEKAAALAKPIMLDVGVADLAEIENAIAFLHHREKDFAILHSVVGDVTSPEHLELNQIDVLRQHFPYIRLGSAAHEEAADDLEIAMAVAKGCSIFDRPVAVDEAEQFCIQPKHIRRFLEIAERAFAMLGTVGERAKPTEEGTRRLLSMRRAVFAKRDIAVGEVIRSEDVFMANPARIDDVTANDWSKYNKFFATQDLKAGVALSKANTRQESIREKVLGIVVKVHELLRRGNIVVPRGTKLELSHHFGLDNFYHYGAALITVVNRDYCKKVLVVLPGQKHPTHYHKVKDETLHVLYGSMRVTLSGETKNYSVGEMIVVEPGMPHSFESDNGCVFEEISTAHVLNDSVYTDPKIGGYDDRKSFVTYWHDCAPSKNGSPEQSLLGTFKSALHEELEKVEA